MSTTISTSDENLLVAMKEHLNKQMLAAAEPILQEALERIEHAMRERLAASLVALIEGQFSMMRQGRDLIITIRREP